MSEIKRTLTVISPVYNEQENLPIFYIELRKVLDDIKDHYESKILFVIDRCSDSSLSTAKRIADSDGRVQVLGLSSRFGHQMSLVAGIDHSDSDAIIMMDSDLQHPPSVLPRLLEQFEKGKDVVYTIRRDNENVGLLRRQLSSLFYRVVNRLANVPIHPGAADFRLISRRVALIFREQLREHNQFLRGLISWVGFDSAEVEFEVEARRSGESKYKTARLIQFALEGITSFSKAPLRWGIFGGLALALLGFLYAFNLLVKYLFTPNYFPTGWATLAILILIFGGTQLFFLGVIGEYIGSIFDEVKRRPLYIVDEKVNL